MCLNVFFLNPNFNTDKFPNKFEKNPTFILYHNFAYFSIGFAPIWWTSFVSAASHTNESGGEQ